MVLLLGLNPLTDACPTPARSIRMQATPASIRSRIDHFAQSNGFLSPRLSGDRDPSYSTSPYEFFFITMMNHSSLIKKNLSCQTIAKRFPIQ